MLKKLTTHFTLFLLAGVLFSSCKKDDDKNNPQPGKQLSVSSTSLTFSNSFQLDTLEIVSNTTWTVASNQAWCQVSPASGANNESVLLYLQSNTTIEPRVAIISITGEGATPVQVTVTQNGPAGTQYLCSGKPGVNAYYPLAMGNKWNYKYNYFTSTNQDETYEVTGTQVYGGQTYMKVSHYNPLMQQSNLRYFRTDPANGDVYQYYDGTEMLLLPGNPTVNQMIGPDPMSSGLVPSRKVVSVTGTLNTPNCAYTDLLVIEKYGQSGGLVNTVYYKKGLGMVKDSDVTVKAVVINN